MTTISIHGDYIATTSADFDNPYTPVTLVTERFTDTLAKAEAVYEMLVGDGSTTDGFLGDIASAITSAPSVSITAPTVDTSLTLSTSGTAPVFDPADLADFPTSAPTSPSVGTLPTITSTFTGITVPDDVTLSMTWAAASLPSAVYSALTSALTTHLASGDTGITSAVEAAIYTRARNRQIVDRTAEYNRINDTALQFQFALPSGVLTSALTDFGLGANRQDADIENTIIVTQAERAQANLQFVTQAAVSLEDAVRRSVNDSSGQALEYVKALAAETREYFSAQVQKYLAQWEEKKLIVQAQAETLRGFIDAAKTSVDSFRAAYDAFKAQSDAAESENKSLVDIYSSEVQAFTEEERSKAAKDESLIRHLSEKVKLAEYALRAAITEAEQTVSGYSAENSIKERVSSDIGNIAAQVCSSMLSAVHAGATLGYSGSESSSKTLSLGASISENHNAEHDPTA